MKKLLQKLLFFSLEQNAPFLVVRGLIFMKIYTDHVNIADANKFEKNFLEKCINMNNEYIWLWHSLVATCKFLIWISNVSTQNWFITLRICMVVWLYWNNMRQNEQW